MSNNLNSIILEGVVDGEVGLWDTDKSKEGLFELLSTRTVLNAEKTGREETILKVPVYVYGHLAETCQQYLKKGKGVRVVGRLDRYPGNTLAIHAEHVEFRSQKSMEERKTV